MTEDEERLLDEVYASQLALAADLSKALQEKAEWDALVKKFQQIAKEQGPEIAKMALPFLIRALAAAL